MGLDPRVSKKAVFSAQCLLFCYRWHYSIRVWIQFVCWAINLIHESGTANGKTKMFDCFKIYATWIESISIIHLPTELTISSNCFAFWIVIHILPEKYKHWCIKQSIHCKNQECWWVYSDLTYFVSSLFNITWINNPKCFLSLQVVHFCY